MVTRIGSRQFGSTFRLLRLFLASTLIIASNTPSWALLQSTDDSWTAPLNLSHSGVAVNPSILIDSEAGVHAVWQDETADFVYTRLEGDQWSAPETTELNRLFMMPETSESPDQAELSIYTGPNPLFLASPGPYIFAFWISAQDKLFTSKVTNQNFKHVSAWNSGGVVASDVASFAVAVDERGEWHLTYFRTVDDPQYPAGIYYTRSRNSGWNWAVPQLIYESPYIRSLGEGEANLSIATAGIEEAVRVYIAWDNRPRKQVLFTQSADGGKSWEQPTLIGGPAPDSGSASPFNIHVGANKESVVLIWQSGRPDGACTQFFRFSSNGGAIWSEPQPMFEELSECPHANKLVAGLTNNPSPIIPPRLYLLTETQSQIYLSAWNGVQWSEPQEQPILAGFEDPEIFTQVDYTCHRASLLGEQLYIIGCDQGEGGDVWVTSRELGSYTSWFSSPVWGQPSPVTDDNIEMEAVELVTTSDDLIHAFFNQHQDPVIYNTYWDGELWSHITPVLKLPDGEAGWPAVAAGPGNELFLITPSSNGELYFSRATSNNSVLASSWSTPIRLEIDHDGEIGSVDVAWDAAGTVYVVYSVPVNEERGIYLVQSKDHGTSWSKPLRVFNGEAADFDLVGAPSLLISENGFLHIVWKELSIQGDGVPQPLSLHYTRSDDGGNTFNEATQVVEEPVAWREIVTDGEGNLHLLWQAQDALTAVWDQVSLDGGLTWQYPQGLPNEGRLAAITKDSAGNLHLFGIGPSALSHWFWNGSNWQSEVPLDWAWTSAQESSVELLTAAVNTQGKVMVVLAKTTGEGDLAKRMLFYSTRTLDLPPNQTVIQEVPTETLSSPTITASTSTPKRLLTPTAQVDNQITNQGQMDRIETNNPISPFTMALFPVALILLSVLGIVIRRVVRNRDR